MKKKNDRVAKPAMSKPTQKPSKGSFKLLPTIDGSRGLTPAFDSEKHEEGKRLAAMKPIRRPLLKEPLLVGGREFPGKVQVVIEGETVHNTPAKPGPTFLRKRSEKGKDLSNGLRLHNSSSFSGTGIPALISV